MSRVELSQVPLKPPDRFTGVGRVLDVTLFGLFLLSCVVVGVRTWRPGLWFGHTRWPEGVLVLSATATTLTGLTRRLPGQNVVAAALLIAVMAGSVQCLGTLTGIPFGPYAYTEQAGRQLFNPLPWPIPLVWIIILLNAREVSRLALRPWRETHNYGFWLIGVAVALIILMDLGLEPFATRIHGYWTWKQTRVAWEWCGAPWVNFLGWAVSAGVILAFTTPFLVNKSLVVQPPAIRPAIVWLALNGILLIGASVYGFRLAAAVIAGHVVLATVLAMTGRMGRRAG